MRQIEDMFIKSEIINGQEFYIPDTMQWEVLLNNNPIINGKHLVHIGHNSEGMFNLLKGFLKFINSYHGFTLAFYEILPERPWYFCIIQKRKTSWQRVNIEHLTCNKCGWSGLAANPTDTSLYAGSSDKTNAINSAWEIPVVPCPKCGAELPRHPIWVEPN